MSVDARGAVDAPGVHRSVPTTLIAVHPSTNPRRRLPRSVIKTISPLALLLIWYVASSAGWLSAHTLAGPQQVLRRAGELIASGEL